MQARHFMQWIGGALFLAAGALAAGADEVYVAAATGSDTTGDGSVGLPWRTITHAIATLPTALDAHTIHVAPGTYDAVLGEVFPLTLRPRMRLVSDAGPELTRLVGEADATLILMESSFQAEAYQFDPDTLVAGFGLIGGQRGVALLSDWVDVSPTLRDLQVRGMRWGIFVQTFGQGGEGAAYPLLEDVVLRENSEYGLRATALGGNCVVTMRRCLVSENGSHGAWMGNFAGSTRLTIEDSSVLQNGGDGISLAHTNEGRVSLDAQRVVIASNLGVGIRNDGDPGPGGSGLVDAGSCTIAFNGVGVRSLQLGSSTLMTRLEETIVWGNGRDLQSEQPPLESVVAAYCDIGMGAYEDGGGNFSADPEFWNPLQLDLHLRSSSPCIDSGNPASPPDADGSRSDIGALPWDAAFCGSPQLYCTAKIDSQGCVPSMHYTGPPSLSSPLTMQLWVTEVINNKNGLLFYGVNGPAALPFFGGILCARPPLRRTPVTNSLGNPLRDDCSGVLGFDFTSWLQSGVDPDLILSASVNAQFWYRDPASPDGVGISNAVSFEVCP